MSGRTDNFGLSTIGAGDSFSDDGFKYSTADRETIDRLLGDTYQHRHDGAAAETLPDLDVPTSVAASGGAFPASVTIYWRYTLVAPNSLETEGSDILTITTGAAVSTPGVPTISFDNVGGTLLPGQYFYVITAYKTSNTFETTASGAAGISIPVGTSTNRVLLTLPSLPSGATGFNVYRRKPGNTNYTWLTAIVGGGGSTYTDTGVSEDPNRFPSQTNTTGGGTQYTISLPDDLDPLPDGYTWKLYRTFTNNDWSRSLLHHVVEESSPGVIETDFVDTGATATTAGEPPTASQLRNSPDKIELTDAGEIQGRAPLSAISSFPETISFAWPGEAEVVTGTHNWVCPYPKARVISARVSVGRGFTVATSDLVLDINKGTGANPTYTTIFTTQANRPKVAIGAQVGSAATPDISTLLIGDSITADVDQVGTNCEDVTVTLLIYAYGWTSSTSEPA